MQNFLNFRLEKILLSSPLNLREDYRSSRREEQIVSDESGEELE